MKPFPRTPAIILALFLIIAAPTVARAGDLSLSLSSGVSVTNLQARSGFEDRLGVAGVYGLTAAYHFPFVRLELTGAYHSPYSYRSTGTQASEVNSSYSSYSLIPAVRLSLPIFLLGDIYGLAGIGLSFNQTKNSRFSYQEAGQTVTGTYDDKSSTQMAYVIGAGVSTSVLGTVLLDAGYRYTDLGQFKNGQTVNVNGANVPRFIATPDPRRPSSHDFILSVGIKF
ncbi:MAG: outer membrane beta-barrel protein [Candidatus Pacebacteria bacterium]|nr:outer membrane beta-barrel protein [Candidatus Paceibacterota bacterium]